MMEPRTATSLDGSRLETIMLDPTATLEPPPTAHRLRSTKPTFIRKEMPHHTDPTTTAFIAPGHWRTNQTREYTSLNRLNSGAPIAQVLNNDVPILQNAQHASSALICSTVPFSGRLSDLLLDSIEETPNKWRKQEPHSTHIAMAGCDNSVIQLPKPPHYHRTTAKRQRIPPLLQGLHQPPPLPPEGRLFPPITSESSTFTRDVAESVALNTISDTSQGKGHRLTNDEINMDDISRPSEDRETRRKYVVPMAKSPESATSQGASSSGAVTATVNQGNIQRNRGRKRHRWSESETKDLLIGVKRFGIGNWKRILHCPDFQFSGRNAVDLKDRFRICRPGEGLKPRSKKSKEHLAKVPSNLATIRSPVVEDANTVSYDFPSSGSALAQEVVNEQRRHLHRVSSAELAELGIRGPFVKSTRRPRREFSTHDDENLLRGFRKYGTVWHLMRNDRDLGFEARHPTDLRDRFRIRYPETYAEAGYKLKPKDECVRRGETGGRAEDQARQGDQTYHRITDAPLPTVAVEKESYQKSIAEGMFESKVPSSSILVPTNKFQGLGLPLMDMTPGALLETTDLVWEDGTGSQSPIILNRDILQWADANPASLSSYSMIVPSASPLIGDTVNGCVDESHVGHVGTLQTPVPTLLSNNLLATWTPSLPPSVSPLKLPTSDGTVSSTINAPNKTRRHLCGAITTSPSVTSSRTTSDTLLRTPNLPTLVCPRVPVASARSAVHSLPPPADLLSGLDTDKPDWQSGEMMLDDALHPGIMELRSGFVTSRSLSKSSNAGGETANGLDRFRPQ